MSDEPNGPADDAGEETDEVVAHSVEIEESPELGAAPFLDINFGCK